LWSPGGIKTTWHLSLGLAWVSHRWVGLYLSALVPIAAGVVSGPEGESDVWISQMGAGARLRFTRPESRVGFEADVGLGLVVLALWGRAVEPLVGVHDRVLSAAISLRPAVWWMLAQGVHLRFAVDLGLALPRTVVAFADRAAASWGRPYLAFSLGLDVLVW
jgi:hypothetical protein